LNLLLGLGRVGRLNIFDAGSQLLTLLNAVVAVVIIGTGLLPLIALNTAAAALICVLLVWTISRAVINNGSERKFAMNVPLFWQMIRNGLKFYVSTLAAALILRADLLIVNYFRGAAEAGVYAVASQFALMLMLLPGIIATLLFPRASAQPDPRGEFTRKVTRHTAFVMSVITLLSVPGSFLLPLLYGREFADVTVQLLILLPGVFFLGIEAVLVQHFNSLGLPIIIPVFWVITLVMNMALNLIFVPTFGARAAALISTLSYTLIFVLVTSYFRSSTGNRLSTTFLLQTAELRELMSMARGNFSSQQ
jgi:O-antigen/teichoic acid export membrane protein